MGWMDEIQSNHRHTPHHARPDPHVHESRLVKSPTPASRRATLVVSRPRVTTRQIPPSVSSSLCRRLDVARVDRSRRARASPSSSSSSTASASASRERTNTRMKIYTSRRRPALERVDVDRERTRAQRSDDPPTLDRRFARSTRRPEGPRSAIDRADADRARRERCAREFDANESTRPNERMGAIDRVVASSRERVSIE